ncbi:NDR1/HIN1-like protein 13 [Bienertia sinuspersici]
MYYNNNNNKPPHYPLRPQPHPPHHPRRPAPQPHPHPPPPPPPPHRRPQPKPPNPNRSTLSSCIVATIFLIFIIIILFIIYFSLFKPKHPTISITAINLPSFSITTNGTTVNFTFSLYAAIKNPNRGYFSHYDSSLQLLYSGNQVGFMFIPSGNISAGKTKFIAATFAVQSFPLSAKVENGANSPAMAGNIIPMELEMRLELVGSVRVLWVFNHHIESVSDCRIAVSISDGSVLGFHC